jgi:hypothetical protein
MTPESVSNKWDTLTASDVTKAVIGAPAAKAHFVRKADIWAECSKGLLPAISTSGGVAASYGSGYALEFMREHMERVW